MRRKDGPHTDFGLEFYNFY